MTAGGLFRLLLTEMDVKWRVLSRFRVIMFFWRVRAQTEGEGVTRIYSSSYRRNTCSTTFERRGEGETTTRQEEEEQEESEAGVEEES